jgi:arylsulfatase A-like enzyme
MDCGFESRVLRLHENTFKNLLFLEVFFLTDEHGALNFSTARPTATFIGVYTSDFVHPTRSRYVVSIAMPLVRPCITVCLLIFASLFGRLVLADPPNVVFLLSDDHAWNDYGFMGHPHLKTPNLDRLAKAGLLYERGYVTAPLCRPSLASLITGMHPHQTCIRGNDPVLPSGYRLGAGEIPKNQELKAVSTQYRDRMTTPIQKLPSFIKLLQQHGYATLQTGKWWEGNPLDHGFTDAMSHGDHVRGGRHGDLGLKIGRETMQPIYDFVDKASSKKQPFFIWYGVFLPHSPHDAPDRLLNKYKDVAPDLPTAHYWANVERLDETCGEIVRHLKSKGLYENTLFVYTCDNGWVPDPKKINASVRSKREPVEAGIRTPIFITQEGTIASRRDAETLASNIDVPTTILRACGIPLPPPMSGLDLRDPDSLRKRERVFVEVYEHDSNLDHLDDLNHGLLARVVISGWDKLILRPSGKELFDLKLDPDDRHDLSANDSEKANSLAIEIDRWVAATK